MIQKLPFSPEFSALCIGLLSLGLLATPTTAHEDDPKILDRKAPVTSQGYRSSLPMGGIQSSPNNPGQNLLGTAFSSDGITLLSWVPLNQIDSADTGNDCWGYVSPSGIEYAIMCTSSGTAFFNLSDPGNPTQVGYIAGSISFWRDAKIFETHCYIVSDRGGGIQVVDLTNIDSGQVTLANTILSQGTFTHNVAINVDSGFLYRCGGSANGLNIYDLNADPVNPPHVGFWNIKYVHDLQVVSYTTGPHAGKEVAFCCGGFNSGHVQTGLTILDVTDKTNPIVMGEAFYSDPAYSHQGWLSEDRQLFYLGDELDEDGTLTTRTHIIDVSDLNNPVAQGFFTNGNTSIGHNLYTKDGLIFEANYTSGLRIFDYASNPANPQEVAYFDTHPSGDGDTFNGLWGVYPYFPSGIVIGSDVERGLFVMFLGDPQLEIAVVGGAPEMWNPSGQTLFVTIDEVSPGALVSGSPELIYDAGAGPVSVALTSLGGNQFSVQLPSLPCDSPVSWYVQAESTQGFTWSAPENAPATTFQSFAGFGSTNIANYEMETSSGWAGGIPSDDASAGIWTRGNPNGSAAQPEDDHTAIGTDCWFTGQANPGDAIGANDVDNGTTTLVSAALDLSNNPDARISYWRWYVNNGNPSVDDSFEVEITSDGSTWVSVETLGPGHPQASGGWNQNSFLVSDFVTPTAQVRMRFQAADLGLGSIVEAAIDDFVVSETDCFDDGFSAFCEPANINSAGFAASISAIGSSVASDNDLTLTAFAMPQNKFGYFLCGTALGSPVMPGNSMGNICLGGSLGRFSTATQIGFSGTTGAFSLVLDLTDMPVNPSQPVLAGETWYFQAWYRDIFLGISTSNFTNGVSGTFQ